MFIFIKKENALSAIAYLGLIYIFNKNLDDVATALDWYDYRIQLEPIIPTMLPANLFIIPIGFCILYSRYEQWKYFLIANSIFAALISYATLPLMKMVNIYSEKSWNAHLSFLSLIIISILSKAIVDRLKSKYKTV
ncbi:hypothetical protein ACFSYB_21245 [Litchfieldia salsa]